MASSRGVVFPATRTDFLANPVDICFGSMLTRSTAPVTGPAVVDNTMTILVQQLEEIHLSDLDLVTETHPATPSDLVVGLDHVKNMLREA